MARSRLCRRGTDREVVAAALEAQPNISEREFRRFIEGAPARSRTSLLSSSPT